MQRLTLWLLALLVFSIPFENGVTIPGIGSMSRVLGIVSFGAGMAALVGRGRLNIRTPSLFVILALLFTLYGISSYFWSVRPGDTLSSSVTVAQLFVLVWLVWQFCRSKSDSALLMQAFVLGSYVTIAVAFTVFLRASEPTFRNVGSFNPNEFAIVSALAIPLAWYLSLRSTSRWLTWLNMAYPAVAVLGIVLSASRGGLVTALVALAIIPLSLFRLDPVRQLLLFGLITATIWIGFVQAPQLYPELSANIERLSSTSEELARGDLTGRTAIWSNGQDLFLSSPFFGTGLGTFAYAVEPLLGRYKDAHNAFLSIAVGGGIAGLALFVALFAVAFITALGAEAAERPFLVILATALIVAMMPSNADTDKFTWFLLALIANQRPLVLGIRSAVPSTARSSASTAKSGAEPGAEPAA
ncbi:MAG: O-antigen ligase family protein [Trueperaceae bacterium]